MKVQLFALTWFACLGGALAQAQYSDPLAFESPVAGHAQLVSHADLTHALEEQQQELASLRARLASLELMNHGAAHGGGCDSCGSACGGCGCGPYIPLGWHAGAEVLVWKPYLEVAYGFSEFAPDDVTINNISMNFDAGFRTRLGYVAPSGWGASFNYTYFHSAASGGPTTDGFGDTFSGDYSLDYDVFDLELERWLGVSESTVVRLFGGFRYALIDQTTSFLFQDGVDDFAFRSAQQTNAFGLRMGGEGHLRLGRGFGLFGRIAGSVLASDNKSQWDLEDPVLERVSNDHWKAVPVLDAAVGVSWRRGPVELATGYEMTNWFGLADSNIGAGFIGLSNNQDLLLAGFFARLTFSR